MKEDDISWGELLARLFIFFFLALPCLHWWVKAIEEWTR
jgi:hypothetical protein